jgi:hypothetical protein
LTSLPPSDEAFNESAAASLVERILTQRFEQGCWFPAQEARRYEVASDEGAALQGCWDRVDYSGRKELSALEAETVPGLAQDLDPGASDERFVLLTQQCDLVREPAVEATIEVALARWESDPNKIDEKVCIVTVGGSGVGGHLLRRVIAAFPEAKERVPELRMIAGPRIDPESLPQHKGLEVRAYVHELYRHLAACDLAVVQGGLTTSMELTANQRPFLYFPLRHHFEQSIHVRHRLGRYRSGRCMDFETDGPSEIAAAIAEEIGRKVDYRPVETDGAARAASLISELL